ncbi:Swarming motility protein SwrD [bioreactor metagenome]|uniref:Swarming motility protein SwrD n=1 Tax=bioreactor metagenome TaxID=1076179 RepID=A0A645EJK8_9ZZZZ
MIMLTKLNGVEFVLNCDHIETIQESPDTTIQLTNGKIYIVRESMQQVVELATAYRKNIFSKLYNRGDFGG